MTTPGIQHLTGYRLRDYDDLLATLGESRTSQGISLATLAVRVGGYPQRVGQWLRGQHEPSARRLVAVADALGYDLALIPRAEPGGDT